MSLSGGLQLGANLEDALKRYVNAGGSILEALGPASAVAPRAAILDEAVEGTRIAGREGDRFFSVSDIDTGHPALRNVERFEGVKFLQILRLTPAKSRVLARLNDQTPLLLERQMGEGKVLAFASTFDNYANDLPLHASWVSFIENASAYLGGGGSDQPRAAVLSGRLAAAGADREG